MCSNLMCKKYRLLVMSLSDELYGNGFIFKKISTKEGGGGTEHIVYPKNKEWMCHDHT